MRRVLILVISLLVTGVFAHADLLTNGDLDDQSHGPYIGLEYGRDQNSLAPATGIDFDAYHEIYGWMGIDAGIEMQTFLDGSPGPGAPHSGLLNVELDVGNYEDDDPTLWGTGYNGGMYQDVSIPQAGTARLSFYYRGRPDYPDFGENQKYIGETHPAGAASTFAIGVYLNGAMIGTVDVNTSGITGANTFKKTLGDFEWEEFTFDFNLGVGNARIEFRALGVADSFGGLLDTISLELVPIPEPGTYALLGLGLIGIYFLRRRQVARLQ